MKHPADISVLWKNPDESGTQRYINPRKEYGKTGRRTPTEEFPSFSSQPVEKMEAEP